MKKILISLAMIAAVGAIVVGATTAYFSDTEESKGNTFTAGTIDIAIDSQNPWTKNYQIGDLKPGETGYINFDIQNVGQNPVNISKNVGNFVESTGTQSEPECDKAGGAWDNNSKACDWDAYTSGLTATADENDVQTQIIYDLSVEVYNSAGTKIWWQAIYTDAEGKKLSEVYPTGGTGVALGMIPVGGHMKVTQSYHFSAGAGNEYQGDQLSFDITIKADQLAQGNNGLASVVLENKTAGPEYDIIADDYHGTLTYKTMNPTFDFSFTGKVKQPSTAYTLLYAVDPWPQTGSKVLGTVTSGGAGEVNFSGTATPGSITNGKVWLVLSNDWGTDHMIDWHQADYLLETGLINYTQN